LRSSYILTPLHSFTGPVGQPFASRLGGGGAVHTRRVHPHFWNWDLLLAISRYRQAVYYPIVSFHNPHTVLYIVHCTLQIVQYCTGYSVQVWNLRRSVLFLRSSHLKSFVYSITSCTSFQIITLPSP
jgi:hypothetical protein